MRTATHFEQVGQLLVERGMLTPDQLRDGRRLHELSETAPLDILVRVGNLTHEDIARVLAEAHRYPYLDLTTFSLDPAMLALVPAHLCLRHVLIPIKREAGSVVVAMADPLNLLAVDEVRLVTGLDVGIVVASHAKILNALATHHAVPDTVSRAVQEFTVDYSAIRVDEESVEGPTTLTPDAPIVKLVQTMMTQAVRRGASDIHIEPLDDTLMVRYRIDGLLHDVLTPPKQIQAALVSRIKIMAGLDIAERRLPQDGRIRLEVDGQEYDVRVATMPTIYGEKAALRILDRMGGFLALESLGLAPKTLERCLLMILKPHGMILVTGPTGSGKSTTLASFLAKLNTPEKHIITIEDPVEYRIRRINQVQVNARAGLTFARALRHFIRQDPEVIMVGEIRDRETAEVAVHAALTGHLMLSTLHTNDAPSAITRLIDMGTEPFLIASSLIGVLAQRLVRVICPRCKIAYAPPAEALERLGLQPFLHEGLAFRGQGCEHCAGTGYRGRTGVFELLVVDETIGDLVMRRAPSTVIRQHSIDHGMISMLADGLAKVAAGITSVEEVLRVVHSGE